MTRKYLSNIAVFEEASLAALPSLNLSSILAENSSLQGHLIRKGHQVKQLLDNAVFMSFALLILGCLAKIKANIEKIDSKVKALDRIVKQVSKKGKKGE